MNIILRHTLRSISKSKGQVAIIMITIIVISLVIFASFSMSDIFYNLNAGEFERTSSEADILVGGHFGGETYSKDRLDNYFLEYPNDVEYIDYFFKIGVLLRTKLDNQTVLLEATNLNDYINRHPIKYAQKYEGNNEYPSAIISERLAKSSNIAIGSTVEVFLATVNRYQKLTITYIAKNEGIFASATANSILTDISAVESKGLVNASFIKLKDTKTFDKHLSGLQKTFPTVGAVEASNQTYINNIAKSNTLLFTIGIIFIIGMMMLIMLSSYLIIARARLAEMVIFKASGATPAQTALIMLAEVLFYGIIGSAIGIILSRIFIAIGVKILLPYASYAITFQFYKYIFAFLLSLSVCVLATISPIMSISRKSIRALTSGAVKEQKNAKPITIIIASIFVICSILAIFLAPKSFSIFAIIILLPSVAMWIFCVVPYAIKFFSYLFSLFFAKTNNKLASVTLKRNGATHNISLLVAVVIAFSFMVVSVIDIVIISITPYNSRYSADYVVNINEGLSSSSLNSLVTRYSNIDGIKSGEFISQIGLYFLAYNPEVVSTGFTVFGVGSPDALDNVTQKLSPDVKNAFKNAEHPIILSTDLLLRLNLKVGDEIPLYHYMQLSDESKHVNLDTIFLIVGEDSTATEYDFVAFAKYDDLTIENKLIAKNGMIFLEGARTQATFDLIRADVEVSGLNNTYLMRFEEWAFGTSKGLEGVSVMLKIMQIVVSLVAVIGVINICIVTIYDRKQEFGLYRLSGMSSSQYLQFSLAEGAILCIVGGIIGLLLSFVIYQIMPILAIFINKYLAFAIFPISILVIAPIGVLGFASIYFGLARLNKKDYLKPIDINKRS